MIRLSVMLVLLLAGTPAWAVTKAEDIATAIVLRGHDCGGTTVSDIKEEKTPAGGQTITATCPNGKRYRLDVTPEGVLTVRPLAD